MAGRAPGVSWDVRKDTEVVRHVAYRRNGQEKVFVTVEL